MGEAPEGPLAVVVVNYGSHRLLEANLVPVARHTPGLLVVVVDSFSTGAEREAVRRQASEHGWHTVLPETNVGFGAGMNLGMGRALALGATAALLLNPDATVDAAGLDRLRRRVADDPMALVSPVVERPDGSVWFSGAELCLDDGTVRARRPGTDSDARRAVPWLSGACLMVSAPLWRRLGGFDPEYFLYWEDVDLSHRARLAGARLVVDPGARAVHAPGGTQGGGARAKSETYYYYNIRNRLLFAARHLDETDRRRWARTVLPTAWAILLRGGRRQFLRPRAPLTAAARGVRDGLRIARTTRRALLAERDPRPRTLDRPPGPA